MNSGVRVVVFWIVVGVAAILLWQVVRTASNEKQAPPISYSQFMSEVEAGRVASVQITGDRISGHYSGGSGAFWLIGPSASTYVDRLQAKGVEIWFKDSSGQDLPMQLLGTWAPLLLLGALWFFMIRQMRISQRARAGAATSASEASR